MVMGVFRRSAAGPEKLSAASRSLGLDALFRREFPSQEARASIAGPLEAD